MINNLDLACEELEAFFDKIGMPKKRVGYKYFRFAIETAMVHPEYYKNEEGMMYKYVANHFNVLPQSVEDGMTRAVETLWNSEMDMLTWVIRMYHSEAIGYPNNYLFVKYVAMYLRVKCKVQ